MLRRCSLMLAVSVSEIVIICQRWYFFVNILKLRFLFCIFHFSYSPQLSQISHHVCESDYSRRRSLLHDILYILLCTSRLMQIQIKKKQKSNDEDVVRYSSSDIFCTWSRSLVNKNVYFSIFSISLTLLSSVYILSCQRLRLVIFIIIAGKLKRNIYDA